MDRPERTESFRSQLLRYRSRTRLTQREFAARVGVHARTVQDWEVGGNYPTVERLQALLAALLESGGLGVGHEVEEARALWAAVERDSPRMHAAFDSTWFDGLLRARAKPAQLQVSAIRSAAGSEPVTLRQDWGEASDTLGFVNRTDELALLRGWVLEERCRLVALLGMGGIGKTSLAAKLAQDVAPRFERVYWRGLRDAPPPGEYLAGAIGFLSNQQLVSPTVESEQIAAFLRLLRDRRCLLVLDNSEALFEPGEHEGHYRSGMAGYGRILQAVGGATHQSCLVLTTREAPRELSVLASDAVRSFELGGLGVDEARVLLAPKELTGSAPQWHELNTRFGGNGLALKVVGGTIRELFDGEIGGFLEETSAASVFGGIRRLLAEQVERSTALEQQVLRVLAVEREPVRLVDLLAALGPSVGRAFVLEAVEGLRRRSLVEHPQIRGAASVHPLAGFTLQSVVLEYVTDRLVADVADEIVRGEPVLLAEQPLIKAQAKDYVRQTQERLIGGPILAQVRTHQGEDTIEQRLLALLDGWRDRPPEEQGYGPGNVVNLLRLLRGDLRELDLSHLVIRQAYLAEVDAQDANLVGAHLAETVLAEAFYFPPSLALSADGTLLVAGTSTGEVWLWRVSDRTPLWLAVQAHTGVVFSVALSADKHLLASGGGDGMVRLWETAFAVDQGVGRPAERTQPFEQTPAAPPTGGRAVATLEGHRGAVWSVALSSDGQLVASGGADGTVRLWETAAPPSEWRAVFSLHGHTGTVRGVAVSADGHLVASCGDDGTVKLWDTRTRQPIATFEGHSGTVWGVALSPHGHLVASGGADGTVRLWDSGTGRPLGILQGHSGTVWGVVLSADGQQVASGSADGTVRLWEAASPSVHRDEASGARTLDPGHSPAASPSEWRPAATLPGHSGPVRGVALSADARLAASGSFDGSIKLWEASTGRPVATLQGLTGGVFGVALAGDGGLLASGNADGTARLWETGTGRSRATLQGHTGTVESVALSLDGHLVATGGDDGTVKLWNTSAGQPLATLQGYGGMVLGVALSPDGRLVGSSGTDGAVRLWDSCTGRPLGILQGHRGTVWGVASSADGHLVASSGEDGTVRLWQTASAGVHRDEESAERTLDVRDPAAAPPSEWHPLAILQGHSGTVWSVALSTDGQLAASSGEDGTVRLWQAASAPADRTDRRTERTQQSEHPPAAPGREWHPLAILQGHSGSVYGVALPADGHLVVSGGADGTVRLWETSTGRPVATLLGHTGTVRGVAFSADGHLVASGGLDGTVKLWETKSGACLRTVQPERRYKRLDITGLTGITEAQRAALLALGAVERF